MNIRQVVAMFTSIMQVRHISQAVKAGLLAVSVVGLVGCQTEASEPTIKEAPKEAVRPVRAEQVVLKALDETSNYSGEVRARYVTDLGFRVAGKLVARKVEVGTAVKAGQLLAKIDPSDYRLSVQSAQAQMIGAQADNSKAKSELARYASLLSKSAISRNEYENILNNHNLAEARFKQAKANLETAQNQVAYTDLHADHDGVVTEILAEVGQVIAQGQTMFRIARTHEKEVAVSVPENRLAALREPNELGVRLWAYPEKTFQGKIREISPKADPATRTYTVKVNIVDSDDRVQLGMTANVFFNRKQSQNVATLPLSALHTIRDKAAVWVVDNQTQTVNLVPVQLGEFVDNQVTILSGLQSGQWVVTAGTHKLYAGQKVRLL
jgi:multidrug efflux system membrane fusion protein